jgi:hypothetical protein
VRTTLSLSMQYVWCALGAHGEPEDREGPARPWGRRGLGFYVVTPKRLVRCHTWHDTSPMFAGRCPLK